MTAQLKNTKISDRFPEFDTKAYLISIVHQLYMCSKSSQLEQFFGTGPVAGCKGKVRDYSMPWLFL